MDKLSEESPDSDNDDNNNTNGGGDAGSSTRRNNVMPSIRTVNAVLHAHAKQASQYVAANSVTRTGYKQAAECAHAAYQILQDTKERYKQTGEMDWAPDITTYTTLIDVFSRCASYEGAKRGEELLQELKDLYAQTKAFRYKVNFRTYTAVITAWARSRSNDAPQRVEALLEEMANDEATWPNARTYTAAIQCWARSRDPLKAKRVLKILMDMREEFKTSGRQDVRPTVFTYNMAIEACSRCQGTTEQQTEALKIAFAILKTIEMDDVANPSATTYKNILSTVSLLPPGRERNKIASSVFAKSKAAGLADFDTVRTLRRTVDSDTMRDCLEGKLDSNGVFHYEELPAAWSKNA